MGAEGWITIVDAEQVDDAGLDLTDHFYFVYNRVIFGKKVYTVYEETEKDCDCGSNCVCWSDFKEMIIDEWKIWS